MQLSELPYDLDYTGTQRSIPLYNDQRGSLPIKSQGRSQSLYTQHKIQLDSSDSQFEPVTIEKLYMRDAMSYMHLRIAGLEQKL